MTQARLLTVALKLAGLLCLLRAAEYLILSIAFPSPFDYGGSIGHTLLYLLGVVLLLAVFLTAGSLLIAYAAPLSRKLMRDDKPLDALPCTPDIRWYAFAFCVAGAVFLVTAVPRSLLFVLSSAATVASGEEWMRQMAARNVVTGILQLGLYAAACLYLIFGARHLARVVLRLNGEPAGPGE